MLAQYNNNGHAARYVCSQMQSCYGEAFCQSLAPAAPLDALVSGLVLQALEPAAMKNRLPWRSPTTSRPSARRSIAIGDSGFESADYEVERARRQYAAVEPENRLVARTLERDWEKALTEQARLEAEHERVKRARKELPLQPSWPRSVIFRRICRRSGAPKPRRKPSARPSCACSSNGFWSRSSTPRKRFVSGGIGMAASRRIRRAS